MSKTQAASCQHDTVLSQSKDLPVVNNRTFISDYHSDEIKEALLPAQELTNPQEELIAISEAVFEFIQLSDLNLEMKNAFYRLQKQFYFYKNLLALR